MTIPMDNNSDNPSSGRVQRLFNKNVELENRRRKAAQARIPSDPNAWQQMRENFEAIVLEDHAFSEQHEIEYALWQLHYRRIEELRAHFNAAVASAGSGPAQNGKGPSGSSPAQNGKGLSGSSPAQNGKGPSRGGPDRVSKIRTQFKTFLSEATGFYHDLMLKIRAKYGLSLGYFSDDSENQVPLSKDGNKITEVKKGLISCHRCLIYLGDLARYKGLYGEGESKARDFSAASSYYMQATSLCPSSGNPHHQLAILASYSGDELVATYRYFRSLAVDSPFTTARDNLIIAFEKNRQSYTQLLGDTKPTSAKTATVRVNGKGRGKGETRVPPKDTRQEASLAKEKTSSVSDVFKAFSTRFVRLNGILFTRTSLETFGEVFSAVRNDLVELLSSGPEEAYNLGSDAADCRLTVVRLIAILIFTVHNVNRETENQSYAEILQRSALLQNAYTAVFEFMGRILERGSQLNDPSGSFLLSGVMIFVEWLASHQDVAVGSELEEKQANARLFFWNSCITFLNRLLSNGSVFVDENEDESCFVNMVRYEEGETANRLALPEDFELRGFHPVMPAHLILDFSRKHSFGTDGMKEKKARIQRIIAAGKALANFVKVGEEAIYFDTKLKKFVIGVEPEIVYDDSLGACLGNSKFTALEEKLPVTGQLSSGVSHQKPQLFMEAEEEDEVIVFKPSMIEKHVDVKVSNPASSEILVSNGDSTKVDLGNDIGSQSTGLECFLKQNGIGAVLRAPTPVVNSDPQYIQPVQQSTSMWLGEQGTLVSGVANINMMENGTGLKIESQNYLGAIQPPAFSASLPQPVNFVNGGNYSVQIAENVVPSKFDSVMSVGAESLSMKPSLVASVGMKKSPVSRPLRHLGPPPGFGSVPSKNIDESLSATYLKNENTTIPPMDDYSWLDGYQLPSVNRSIGFSTTVNNSGQMHNAVNKNNTSMGMASFPFPGKQVSTLQSVMVNQKGWQDYQLSEQMKLLQEEHQLQLQKGKQQNAILPQQYQGQSLWEGRFFE